MAIQVLIYDDNAAIRASMQALLNEEHDIEVTAAMPNAETIAEDLLVFKPDVVLMDIDMPEINGIEAIRRIRKTNAHLPIIMLTVFDDNENIFNAICAGATGYILKRYAIEEIPDALRSVMNGGAPMTGSVARKVLQMLPKAKNEPQGKTELSQKETAILQSLVNGYSYKMIATECAISIDTVRFHIKKIYDKLHVHSATEAVSKALKEKLVSLFF